VIFSDSTKSGARKNRIYEDGSDVGPCLLKPGRAGIHATMGGGWDGNIIISSGQSRCHQLCRGANPNGAKRRASTKGGYKQVKMSLAGKPARSCASRAAIAANSWGHSKQLQTGRRWLSGTARFRVRCAIRSEDSGRAIRPRGRVIVASGTRSGKRFS